MIKKAGQPERLMDQMGMLADPTRLRLLRLLEGHELGVVDLCDVLQCPQSTASRHLKVLADHGWTASRRQGTTNLYRMTPEHLDDAAKDLWQLVRGQTEDWATVRQDQVRLERRLNERHDDLESFFSSAAGQWEKLRGDLYGKQFTGEALISLLPADWTVADLGCGSGPVTALLAAHVGKVIAVDQSAAMLKAARKRLKNLSNVEVVRSNLESLRLGDACCDAALILLVLTYLEHPGQAIKEAVRILKPGGKLVIVDLLQHDREDFRRQMGQRCLGFSCEQMTELLNEAGFKAGLEAITCKPLPTEAQAKGPALILATGTRNS